MDIKLLQQGGTIKLSFAQSAGPVQYTDCLSAEE